MRFCSAKIKVTIMAYSLVPIVAFIVAAIINWDVLFNKNYPVVRRDIFVAYRVLLVCLFVFFLADALWGVFDSLGNKIPSIIDTSLFFVTMSFTVTAWLRFAARYLEENVKTSRILIWTGYVFFAAGLALVIVNLFHPLLFAYEDGVYKPKVGRYAFLTAQMVMYVITSLFAFVRMVAVKGDKKGRFLTIALIGIAMTASIYLQLWYPHLPLYSCGCLICLVLLHIFIVSIEKADYRKSISESSEREKMSSEALKATKDLAYKDPLTGVKNKHAYVEYEETINAKISDKKCKDFCMFLFDLNDLKAVNDTYGHEKGDEYIIKSCKMIEKAVPNTDIYRIGGDEFVVFMEGNNYKNRYKILNSFNSMVDENVGKNEPIIALGFSDYVPAQDRSLRTVFTRADERMYSRKRQLKKKYSLNGSNKGTASSDSISRMDMYEMFYNSDKFSLINLLNNSNCDEIVEVDMENDTYKQFYHVDGKYFIPDVGISFAELVKFAAEYIVHPDDVGIYLSLMKKDGFFERLQNSKIPNFCFAHFRYKLQDGNYRYVEQCIITGEENGIPKGMFRLYIIDIHNLMTRRLGVISDEKGVISLGRDPVTGLLTNRDFLTKADEKIEKERDKKWCVLTIDIEHFRFFDEWFGREKGDYLLTKIGVVLSEFEKEMNGVAGYFGQDDFCLLAEYDGKKIDALYEKIRKLISSYGLTTGFLPAIGVSMLEKDMILVDAFDRASIAISGAKKDIRNRICYYTSDMQFVVEKEYRILNNFMSALQKNEITFYLQPQCFADADGPKIVGGEALVRWFRNGKSISPAEFVPILEKYNFITDLDKYVWDKVCKWIKERLDSGLDVVPISLNVSRLDIFNVDIAKHFTDLCDKYKIPHKLIKIEITESSYAEITELVDRLVDRLRKEGFLVLMDDFGSGYSSLNMLSSMKLDAIKLDSKFLNFDDNDDRGLHVLESVVNMAKVMGLPIVVEGVETEKQFKFLRELGVSYIQGYYFYRPVSIEEFEKIISEKGKTDQRGFVPVANEQLRIREFLDKNIYSDSMLNNILGAVAFYSLHDGHVDIVRFNQQFYDSVGVPDFNERLENIERFVLENERNLLFNALEEAKNNHLLGSSCTLRFYHSNGTLLTFRMRFYYLNKQADCDMFYGSAFNDSELANLKEVKELISQNSNDNMIFIDYVNNTCNFSVISHGLSDLFGLEPDELERKLNDGSIVQYFCFPKQLEEMFAEGHKMANKKMDYERAVDVFDKNGNRVKLILEFSYVKDTSFNIDYILKCKVRG